MDMKRVIQNLGELNKGSMISLGNAAMLAWGLLWLNGKFDSLQSQITHLEQGQRKHWTIEMQKDWMYELGRRNSSLVMPSVIPPLPGGE